MMMWVMVCWVLAMIAALSWARSWAVACTLATVLAFLVTRASALATWSGWLQLIVMVCSPWLLASQRRHDEYTLKQLHAKEAKKSVHLGEAARSLLSVQHAAQAMETHMTEITDVYHVTKETARALHLNELFAASLDTAPRLLNARGLRLIDLSGLAPRVLRASRAADGRMTAAPAQAELLEAEQAVVREALAADRASRSAARTFAGPLPEGISRLDWVPLWWEQRPIGALAADELPETQLKMLSIVGNQLSLQLSRIRLYEQVEALAVTDALTGLFVRRHFLERAKDELERSTRHGLACTLLMVDLDHFKQKNDTYGHLVGDVVLRDVAALLQRHLREIDLIARFGGEEFVLLLIETSAEQAMPIAQRLRQLVEVHPIRAYDELLHQTISMGVAGFPEDAQTLEAFIERADQALYAAKRAGRNRVVRWSTQLATASGGVG